MVEQTVVEQAEKTPDDMRVSSEEEPTDLPVVVEKSKRPPTSKPTGRHHKFSHISPKIRIENLVNSRRQPELRAGTARTREKTVSSYRKFLVIV